MAGRCDCHFIFVIVVVGGGHCAPYCRLFPFSTPALSIFNIVIGVIGGGHRAPYCRFFLFSLVPRSILSCRRRHYCWHFLATLIVACLALLASIDIDKFISQYLCGLVVVSQIHRVIQCPRDVGSDVSHVPVMSGQTCFHCGFRHRSRY